MTLLTETQKHIAFANEAYAAKYDKGGLPPAPIKRYAVVTCMDPRIDPFRAFGIEVGDAHIIRNGGGNAQDALKCLVASEQLLQTKEIVLIKHTDCGFTHFENSTALTAIKTNLGQDGLDAATTLFNADFQPFKDVEAALREDIRLLKSSALIQDGIAISGWIFDVQTGKVRHVL